MSTGPGFHRGNLLGSLFAEGHEVWVVLELCWAVLGPVQVFPEVREIDPALFAQFDHPEGTGHGGWRGWCYRVVLDSCDSRFFEFLSEVEAD